MDEPGACGPGLGRDISWLVHAEKARTDAGSSPFSVASLSQGSPLPIAHKRSVNDTMGIIQHREGESRPRRQATRYRIATEAHAEGADRSDPEARRSAH